MRRSRSVFRARFRRIILAEMRSLTRRYSIFGSTYRIRFSEFSVTTLRLMAKRPTMSSDSSSEASASLLSSD